MTTVVSRRRAAMATLLLCGITFKPLNATSHGDEVAASAGPTFSGRATVVRANVLGSQIVLSDTGPLPSNGGAAETSLLTANVPGLLTAEVLHAAVVAHGHNSGAEASVAELSLTVAGHSISAGFLMARAAARCGPDGASSSGSSEIAALRIDGQAIVVSGQPNQTLALPLGGAVIINEQDSARRGDITVNALHVIVPGVADVVISSAHADINCGAPPICDTGDFVTGGGWITAAGGKKGTFGVAGGIRNEGFWGHLTYIDHGDGMKVKGLSVTAYITVDATTRRIRGTADIDGRRGTYEVDVSDNGEPGRNDFFSISLSNGYHMSGLLQGGNIQLHHPCD